MGITGTSYRPKLPSECNYDKELNDIMKVEHSLDRGITLFLWIQRSQMFLDENEPLGQQRHTFKNTYKIRVLLILVNFFLNEFYNFSIKC